MKNHLLSALFFGIFLIIESVLPVAGAGPNQWTSIGPFGGGITALAIDTKNPSTLYAGTAGGALFKSINGGAAWFPANIGLTGEVHALVVDPTTPNTLYAGTYGTYGAYGTYGRVFKSTNGGVNWIPANTGLTDMNIQALAIDPSNPSTLYAGSGSGLFKSTNGGGSWSPLTSGLASNNIDITELAIDPKTPATLYAGTLSNGVFKSIDGGGSWLPINSGLTISPVGGLVIDPSNPTTLYAQLPYGIFKSTDSGSTWNPVSSTPGAYTLAVDPNNSATLYVGVNGTSGVYKSIDGGVNWTQTTSGMGLFVVDFLIIDPSNSSNIYAGTHNGLYKSSNAGGTWATINMGLSNFQINVLGIDQSNQATLYAGTGNGVYKSIDGGVTWNGSLQNYGSVNALAISPTNIYAGIPGYWVWKSSDGAVSWNNISADLNNNSIKNLVIDPNNNATLYAGTYNGGVYKSTNSGANWTQANTGLSGQTVNALSIDSSNSSTIYAGTAIGGVFKSTDGGGNWSPVINMGLLNMNVVALAIDQSHPSTLYAGTYTGIYKSIDAGASWNQANNGLTSTVVQALIVNPSKPTTLFAGTYDGVFMSTDGGGSWNPINAGLTNMNVISLAIDPTITTTLYAGTQNGGVYKISSSPSLLPLAIPPLAATGPVTANSSTTATLNGTVNPNSLATTAQFEYGLTTAYGSTVSVSLSPNNSSIAQNVNTTINGLQTGATYHYRLSATNSAGTGAGNDAVFTVGNAYHVHGLNFSPILSGQNGSTPITSTQLTARMTIIQNHTDWVRTFGASNGLEQAGAIAHKLGLKIAMGAWISTDLAANEIEINNLIAAANRGEADILIVGSETMLRADSGTTPFPGAENALVGYLNRVKSAVPANLPVTYADTYNTLLGHPNLVAACQGVLFVNYYPYWERVRVDKAMLDLNTKHQQVVAIAGGKNVIVSEAGWPSAGNPNGDALPSLDNASFYFRNFVSWARSNNIDYFYFEAFDSVWKASYPQQYPAVESHWGIWDGSDNLKYGMDQVFSNAIMPDNWTMPSGLGQPSLEFSLVPAYGSTNAVIYGKAKHVKTSDYKVALYIYVPNIGSYSGWWVKPTSQYPDIKLDAGGEWGAQTVTGGSDYNATQFAAFLVPVSYSIPTSLTAELYQNAVANVQVTRPPITAYPVNVAINGSGFSTVSSDVVGISCGYPNYDCSETYSAGSTVVLTASATPGYLFTGWSGDCSGTAPTCTLSVNAQKAVTANFTQENNLAISNLNPTGGVITSDVGGINCGTICNQNYASGTIVTLTATPTSGYSFASWSGDCTGTVPACQVTLSAAKNVTANFVPNYAMTVTNSNKTGGSVTSDVGGINCGNTCSQNYASGTVVTLTASPVTGYSFTGWSGDCSGSAPTCPVTLSSAKNVTANFVQSFALTVTNSNKTGGTVTSNVGGITCGATCSQSYASGTVVTLTATPVTGYGFTVWGGDGGNCTGTTCAVTVNTAKNITANFVQNYTLTVTNSNKTGGSVTSNVGGISCGATCSHSYASGATVTLTASPVAGYGISWGGDCSGTASTCQVTLSAAKNVTANFVPNYTLTVINANVKFGTVTSNPGGIVCGTTCSANYASGSNVTLTAIPVSGYEFTGWGGACSGYGNSCKITMDSAKTVTANFAPFKIHQPIWKRAIKSIIQKRG